ncbi:MULTISPECIES: hypothetical protein [unclassified Actinomyces]|uniref:hypothetical protein n=1 Tax=unclassified Actinomyces TaxID=2609248 RepID=UPI0011BE100B|nr:MULTISPECIES: hypothetical protein [unclassified Actinomyces]
MSDLVSTARKTLWHARHGGITGVKEFRRRQRVAAQARAGKRSRVRADENNFPAWNVQRVDATGLAPGMPRIDARG